MEKKCFVISSMPSKVVISNTCTIPVTANLMTQVVLNIFQGTFAMLFCMSMAVASECIENIEEHK